MRVTDKMITNTYLTNLNKSYLQMNDLNEKVTSGRKYLKASEDPATALKAYQVRENLSRISLYKNNVSEVDGLFTDVESGISSINTILADVSEQLVQGRNGTNSSEDLQVIAEVVRNYQSEILSIANSNYGGDYIFGGNKMNEMPFTLEEDGTLLYQGVDVDSNDEFPSEELYYDIGLGLKTDASGNVLSGTALDISNPGSEVFGTGVDENGVSNNLYNLLGQIADLFESGDISSIDPYMTKLEERTSDNLIAYANIGQKTNFIDFLADRFATDETNALEKQQNLEGIDSAQGILEFNNAELAYQAALQMGTKIIQTSLLDYIS